MEDDGLDAEDQADDRPDEEHPADIRRVEGVEPGRGSHRAILAGSGPPTAPRTFGIADFVPVAGPGAGATLHRPCVRRCCCTCSRSSSGRSSCWHFPDPAYPDSSYYVDVARPLHAGHGFNVDFVWIFAEVGGAIPANPVLPIPSNAHWMPLASLVQVPFLFVFGDVGLGVGAAVRADRGARGAADLGDRPRRRAPGRSSRSAPAS